jgi:predicted acyl esterase
MGFVSSGVQDHAPRGERDDVLVFVSEPLPAPLSIAGPVRLELHVEPPTDSSAAFVATLVDVQSDGAAWNVAEGIRRVGAGTGAVDVDLGHAAYEFGRGRRIGLQLSRSSYPRFGLVGDPTTEHVLHDDGHPSALVLSVEG